MKQRLRDTACRANEIRRHFAKEPALPAFVITKEVELIILSTPLRDVVLWTVFMVAVVWGWVYEVDFDDLTVAKDAAKEKASGK